MNTKLVKRITSCSLFACALTILVAAITLSTSGVAQAGGPMGGCSLSTLQGLYVFDAHGWNIVSTADRVVPESHPAGHRFQWEWNVRLAILDLEYQWSHYSRRSSRHLQRESRLHRDRHICSRCDVRHVRPA